MNIQDTSLNKAEDESSCCSNSSCCGSSATVKRDYPKVGRNDLCPCGSERKFKKCCGRAA